MDIGVNAWVPLGNGAWGCCDTPEVHLKITKHIYCHIDIGGNGGHHLEMGHGGAVIPWRFI